MIGIPVWSHIGFFETDEGEYLRTDSRGKRCVLMIFPCNQYKDINPSQLKKAIMMSGRYGNCMQHAVMKKSKVYYFNKKSLMDQISFKSQ